MSDSVIVSGADRKGPSWMIDHPFNNFRSPESTSDAVLILHSREGATMWFGATSVKITFEDALKIVAEWRRRRAIRLMYK